MNIFSKILDKFNPVRVCKREGHKFDKEYSFKVYCRGRTLTKDTYYGIGSSMCKALAKGKECSVCGKQKEPTEFIGLKGFSSFSAPSSMFDIIEEQGYSVI